MMHCLVLCRVIDNYGDAGFALRLARSLCQRGCTVILLADRTEPFEKLLSEKALEGLTVHSKLLENLVQLQTFLKKNPVDIDAVFECFGSSNSQPQTNQNQAIRNSLEQTPWVIIDYLSAEPWVESFHCLPSVAPETGYKAHFFYPGFNSNTGGLLHQDCPALPELMPTLEKAKRVFVFYYPGAPVTELAQIHLQSELTLCSSAASPIPNTEIVSFCAIDEFDHLLRGFDMCFVRGEDSFVRAQLNAKPFVWQIYPTEDLAHKEKLESFLRLYLEKAPQKIAQPIEWLWNTWNGLAPSSELPEAWNQCQAVFPDWLEHAHKWAIRLRKGPELSETLLRFTNSLPPIQN